MLLEKSTLKKTNIFQAYFLRNLTLTTKTQLLETELLIAKQCAHIFQSRMIVVSPFSFN